MYICNFTYIQHRLPHVLTQAENTLGPYLAGHPATHFSRPAPGHARASPSLSRSAAETRDLDLDDDDDDRDLDLTPEILLDAEGRGFVRKGFTFLAELVLDVFFLFPDFPLGFFCFLVFPGFLCCVLVLVAPLRLLVAPWAEAGLEEADGGRLLPPDPDPDPDPDPSSWGHSGEQDRGLELSAAFCDTRIWAERESEVMTYLVTPSHPAC